MDIRKKLTTTRVRESAAARYERMQKRENELMIFGYANIAGIDEAGRGPLAGPVAAAACILDPERPITGLNDSKKLSPSKRLQLELEIKEFARAWSVILVPAEVIDREGINPAIFRAMSGALRSLAIQADYALIDQCTWTPDLPHEKLIKGDANCNCIAAASILAKVERDRYMLKLAEQYPVYGFAQHKGYGTAAHFAAIREFGLCPEHRRSFLRNYMTDSSSR